MGDTSTFDELRGKIPRSGKDTLGDTKEPKGDFVYTKVHLASLTAKQFFNQENVQISQKGKRKFRGSYY